MKAARFGFRIILFYRSLRTFSYSECAETKRSSACNRLNCFGWCLVSCALQYLERCSTTASASTRDNHTTLSCRLPGRPTAAGPTSPTNSWRNSRKSSTSTATWRAPGGSRLPRLSASTRPRSRSGSRTAAWNRRSDWRRTNRRRSVIFSPFYTLLFHTAGQPYKMHKSKPSNAVPVSTDRVVYRRHFFAFLTSTVFEFFARF